MSSVVLWEFEDDDGLWRPYGLVISRKLEDLHIRSEGRSDDGPDDTPVYLQYYIGRQRRRCCVR